MKVIAAGQENGTRKEKTSVSILTGKRSKSQSGKFQVWSEKMAKKKKNNNNKNTRVDTMPLPNTKNKL